MTAKKFVTRLQFKKGQSWLQEDQALCEWSGAVAGGGWEEIQSQFTRLFCYSGIVGFTASATRPSTARTRWGSSSDDGQSQFSLTLVLHRTWAAAAPCWFSHTLVLPLLPISKFSTRGVAYRTISWQLLPRCATARPGQV